MAFIEAKRHEKGLDLCLLVLLMCLSIWMRWPLLSASPHLDEIWHFGISAKHSLVDVVVGSRSVAHPPLYFVVLRLWLPFGSSIEWLRSLSLLASTVSIFFIYLICSSIRLPRTLGLTLCLFWITSPTLSHVAAEVRGYAVSQLFLWINLYAFILVITQGSSRSRDLSFILSGTLALFSIHASIFQVAMTSLFFFLHIVRGQTTPAKGFLKRLASCLPYLGILLVPVFFLILQYQGKFTAHIKQFMYAGSYHNFLAIRDFITSQLFNYLRKLSAVHITTVSEVLLIFFSLTGWYCNFIRKTLPTPLFFVLIGPALLHILASLLGYYPFGGYERYNTSSYPALLSFILIGVFLLFHALSLPPKQKSVIAIAFLCSCLLLVPSTLKVRLKTEYWDRSPFIEMIRRYPAERLVLSMRAEHCLKFVDYSTSSFTLADQEFNAPDPRTKLASCLERYGECYYVQDAFSDKNAALLRNLHSRFAAFALTYLEEYNFRHGYLLFFKATRKNDEQFKAKVEVIR